jgi:hypothetical protein
MYAFFSEIPWWLPLGLVLVGLVLFWTGNNRLEQGIKYSGIALAGLGLVTAIVSYCLESDRELVLRQTRQIVQAVETRDWPTVESLMDPDVALLEWRGRKQLVAGARMYAERFNLKRAKVASVQTTQTRPTIVLTMRVFADAGEITNYPTDWELEWEKIGGNWLLTQIEPLDNPLTGSLDQYFNRKP